MQRARDLGFRGNISSLWRQLDADNSGFITVDEIAPLQGRLILEFKSQRLGLRSIPIAETSSGLLSRVARRSKTQVATLEEGNTSSAGV